MTKPDILLMGPPQHPDIPAELERDFRLHRYWEAPDRAALIAQLAPHLRYISTSGHDGPDAATIRALPKLELISSFGVGYDGIDTAAAQAQGVRVTNTPDVLNDCVAELTLGLMLALAREIPASDRFVRDGRWAAGPYPFTGELTGKRAGILGLGRIGKEIARRLEVFRMEIAYHGRRQQEGVPYRYYGDLHEMAREVDWLIVIAPATAESRHLVDASVLEALGPRGHLVNVARGALVDEAALVEALQTGRIAGAGLDVFEDEPRPLPGLLSLPNTVLTPHTGSATWRTRKIMAELMLANLRAHLAGEPVKTPVV
ncbi:2-hydroxyacid dehydrogenase [Mangrovicoccus algicola]|uniref:2-hydroxyacid dehydrogenase n=1 Tax=Mangrovicoccus algicola TaxID=2771008 RepID=A0A8J6YXZ6_9RHOB|nr:2-hydroxyacid dehydrogenase [Mangrovicoccus algicola]MBE3639962.1 2-hydroxyacid dehydrogenase [Mangrovicoccus algicola]